MNSGENQAATEQNGDIHSLTPIEENPLSVSSKASKIPTFLVEGTSDNLEGTARESGSGSGSGNISGLLSASRSASRTASAASGRGSKGSIYLRHRDEELADDG